MENVRNRRLAVNKASANIKNNSFSSAASSSSSLPSASSARSAARVVSTDPSSFKRVVQELTGSSPSSSPSHSSGSPPLSCSASSNSRFSSRLHRFAPAPLRYDLAQKQQQMAAYVLLQQQQEPVWQLKYHRHQHQEHKKFCSQPPQEQQQKFSRAPSTNSNHFSSAIEYASLQPTLPMLSPQLLADLPALTSGDDAWAHPVDVILSPKFITAVVGAISLNPNNPTAISASDMHTRFPTMQECSASVQASLVPVEAERLPSPMWSLPALSPTALMPLPPISPSILPLLSPSLVSPTLAPAAINGG